MAEALDAGINTLVAGAHDLFTTHTHRVFALNFRLD